MSATTKSIPVPPDELIDRVISNFSNASAESAREAFVETGRRTLQDFDRALRAVGKPLAGYARILEWGCGCGRVTRWMGEVAQNSVLIGTDIDKRAIAWAAANIPFAEFELNEATPPMRYPDGEFDLVLSYSVFTHIDEQMQDLWLAELQRVTAPGGVVVVTVSGSHVFDEILRHADPRDARSWIERLERQGIVFIADDGFVGSAHPSFYHTTVHAPWYVFGHWAQWFDVMAYIPRGSLEALDTVVLRRPAETDARRVSRIRRGAPAQADLSAAEQRSGLAAIRPPTEPLASPSRFGAPGALMRQAVFRLSRPVIMAQHQVNQELAEAIEAIRQEVELSRRMPPMVATVLYQQAERLGRVEQELDALRAAQEELRNADERETSPGEAAP